MIGLGVFCLVIALGLFLRHRWARYGVLALAGFWLIIGLMIASALGYSTVTQPRFGIGLAVNLVITAVAVGLPASYLVYFSRRSIRRFFAPGSTPPRRRPWGLSLIAWWHLVTGVLILQIFQAYRIPAIQLFGVVLTGIAAILVYLLHSVWSVSLGVGLLRGKYWGWVAAVSYQVYLIVNLVASSLFPRMQEVQKYLKAPQPNFSPQILEVVFLFSIGFGLAFSLAILALLIRYRPLFFPHSACRESI